MTHPGDSRSPSPTRDTLIVGIDLGTTNSLVAVCDQAGPRVLTDEDGAALLPSVVRYEPVGPGQLDLAEPGSGRGYRTVVGSVAKREAPAHARTTISSVKRLIGRSLADARGDLRFLSYEVVGGERATARVRVPLSDHRGGARNVLLSPEEVSAEVLARLKAIAQMRLGRPVEKAVITVPAYFDDAQRQATRTAGRLAGLDVVRIVPEPTAAALAYGLGLERSAARNQRDVSHVVVYDLGGGTFDVSVLRLTRADDAREGDPSFYEVLATSGDTHLGGDDIDHMLMATLRDQLEKASGNPPDDDLLLMPEARRELLGACEALKIRLSDVERTSVRLKIAGKELEREVTRAEFEALIQPLVDRTIRSCDQAVRDARSRGLPDGPLHEAIDAVVMVGGSTRIPLVRRRVREFFGLEPYTAVDPDQVVALGAAVQASILSGATKGSLLLDVIPLSLGIETAGGAVAKLIMRNSAVPASATELFSTSVDGQTSIRLTVYQGEREMASDCRALGEFHLRGIPPMPAGLPQLEVKFLVDANGVLSVSALERRSGRRASLQVVPNHGLTSEEVDRIERESVTHARDDMARHRIADLITNSTLDLKWIGEKLAAHRHGLDPGYASELDALSASLRDLISQARADWRSVDPNAFHRAKEALDRASVRLQELAIAATLRDAHPARGS